MILNVARKELKSVFASPMGWVILALLQAVTGFYYLVGVMNYFEVMSGAIRPAERTGVTVFVGQGIFGATTFIIMFAVPLLSMRLISEERRNQTLPFLFTAPLSLTEIVLGKFVGLVVFLSIIVLFIPCMMSTINLWADIDFGYILSNTLGCWLLMASYCSLGLYFSSLTAVPVVAAIFTFITLFALMMLDRFSSSDNLISYISPLHHFMPMSRGLLDSSDIAYFLIFISTFLVLTLRRLDADRLSA